MGENLGTHPGGFDGANKRQGVSAMRTGDQVDRKHPFEQLRLAQAEPRCGRGGIAGVSGGDSGLIRVAGNDLELERGIEREHAILVRN